MVWIRSKPFHPAPQSCSESELNNKGRNFIYFSQCVWKKRINVRIVSWPLKRIISIFLQWTKSLRSRRKAWLLITIFAINFIFFFTLFLGGKKNGENDNQSRGQKSCLSARSKFKHNIWKCYWRILERITDQSENLYILYIIFHKKYHHQWFR